MIVLSSFSIFHTEILYMTKNTFWCGISIKKNTMQAGYAEWSIKYDLIIKI